MLITNNTNVDYWFGPHHLAAGSGQTLTLDDTTDTSLYLIDDAVADAVNTLNQSGMISVSSAAVPFPRPTGTPNMLHGDGSPQGKVYAGQGSLYLRRDNTGGATALFAKTSGVTFNNGWAAISDPWTGLNQTLGLQYSTFPLHTANNSGALTGNQLTAGGVWLNAGSVLTGLAVNYIGTAAPGSTAIYFALYSWTSTAINQVAATVDIRLSFTSTPGWVKGAFTAPYVVPTTGLYYFAVMVVGTSTPPPITYINGAGAQASQPTTPSGNVWPYFLQGTSSLLPATATPAQSTLNPWIAAY